MEGVPSLSPRLGRVVRAVSALVVAASAAYFWATNLADEDLWNHLNFGEQKISIGASRSIRVTRNQLFVILRAFCAG